MGKLLNQIYYFREKIEKTNKSKYMKYSEVIFSLMDEVRQFIEFINQYIHKGIELFEQVRLWIAKAIEYIEARINEFTYRIRNKNVDFLEFSDDDMFV